MYSCQEHIDEVIDRYLDDRGQLPIIDQVKGKQFCQFCQKEAAYQILEGINVEDSE